jgi:hypothetical protein
MMSEWMGLNSVLEQDSRLPLLNLQTTFCWEEKNSKDTLFLWSSILRAFWATESFSAVFKSLCVRFHLRNLWKRKDHIEILTRKILNQ